MKSAIILPFILMQLISSAQQFEWINYSNGAGANLGYHIVVDRLKNTYVAGIFSDTASFGNSTIIEVGNRSDIFLTKYDSIGNFLWVQHIKSIGSDSPHGLKVDSTGSCYLAGDIGWSTIFGSGSDTASISNKGGFDIFLAKYNTNGILQWVKSPGSKKNDYCKGIAIDNRGNVFINGWVNDTVSLGGGANSKTINLPRGAMITAKYDNNGNFIWAQIAKPDNDDPLTVGSVTGYGVGVDKQGNSYICGSSAGANTFIDSLNTIQITSPLNRDPFIAKYSPDGNLLWVLKGINANQLFTLTNLDCDSNGNSYVCGYFDGNITFAGVTINSNDGHILLIKVDSSGNVIWARAEGKANGTARSIVARDDGSCLVTGAISLPAVFGAGSNQQPITGSTAGVSFVAKYDPIGNLTELIPIQSLNKYDGYGVDIDDAGKLYVTGLYEVGVIGNVLIAKLASDGTVGVNSHLGMQNLMYIFPNPTNSTFIIKYQGAASSNIQIRITDILSKLIFSETVQKIGDVLAKEIDMTNHAKGVYFVEIITDSERNTKKIVLE